jgi:hypothetical protein
MNAAELLTNSLSPGMFVDVTSTDDLDHNTRSSATQQLEEAARTNYVSDHTNEDWKMY